MATHAGDCPPPKMTSVENPGPMSARIVDTGCRCRVPGCNNRLFLDQHHLKSRVFGGRHVVANLLTVCSVHHRLIHDGRLAVEVVADGIRFTFPSGRSVTVPLEPTNGAWGSGSHVGAGPRGPGRDVEAMSSAVESTRGEPAPAT